MATYSLRKIFKNRIVFIMRRNVCVCPRRAPLLGKVGDWTLNESEGGSRLTLDWREQADSFEHLVCFQPFPVNLTGDGEPERVLRTQATTGLFELLRVQPAMGIPLIMSRKLTEQDSSLGQPGVLINETAGPEIWPDENPIGKRLQDKDHPNFWYTVVGVVGDVRQWGMERPPIPEMYIPHLRDLDQSFAWVRHIVVRTDIDPSTVVNQVKESIWSVDPNLPVSNVRTTNEIVARSMGRRRFNTILIGIFAATKLTESMIYGVSPTDPKTIAGGIVFLVLIGGLGSLVLARRATRVDPVLAPQGRVSNVCTD